jgi:hypothetical protein
VIVGAVSDVLATAPLAFVLGIIVGLFASSRWLIVRRNGEVGKRPPP